MPHWLASSHLACTALVAMTVDKRVGRVGVAHFPHKIPLLCIGSELDPDGSQTDGADFAHEGCFIRLVLMRLSTVIATKAPLLIHKTVMKCRLGTTLALKAYA